MFWSDAVAEVVEGCFVPVGGRGGGEREEVPCS
jgi:hypothetical protein